MCEKTNGGPVGVYNGLLPKFDCGLYLEGEGFTRNLRPKIPFFSDGQFVCRTNRDQPLSFPSVTDHEAMGINSHVTNPINLDHRHLARLPLGAMAAMKSLLAFVLLSFFACIDARICALPEKTFNGHCYYFSNIVLDWPHAEASCRSWGGDLVAIGTPEEYTWLVEEENMMGNDQWWMGLASLEQYSWAQYSHLPTDQLQEIAFDPMTTPVHCVYSQKEYQHKTDGTINAWIKDDCLLELPFVCERDYIIWHTTTPHTTTTPKGTTHVVTTLPPPVTTGVVDPNGGTFAPETTKETTAWTFPTWTYPSGYTGSTHSTLPGGGHPWTTPDPSQTYTGWTPHVTLGTDPDGNPIYPTPSTVTWTFETWTYEPGYTGTTKPSDGTNKNGDPIYTWTTPDPNKPTTDEIWLPPTTRDSNGNTIYL